MEWEHEVEIKHEAEMYDFEAVQSPLDIKFEIDDYLICSREIIFDDDFDRRLSEELIEAVQPKQETYNCRCCSQRFEQRQQLLEHNLVHLQVSLPLLYECCKCQACYINKSDLSDHLKTYHNPQKHPCTHCSKIFTSYKGWHEHISFVHSTRCFICYLCNRSFKCKKYLKNHLRTHLDINQKDKVYKGKKEIFNCSKCPKIFYRKESLTCHMRNVHSDKVKCDICGSGISKSYLAEHRRRVHYDDGKDHPCNICNKKFRSPRYLAIHKNSTHKLKHQWHDCPICNFRFKNKGFLQNHFKLVHFLDKYYECSYCYKKFASKEHSQKHKKICSKKYTKNGVGELKKNVNDNNPIDVEIKVEVVD